ncbi:MAG: ATP-binding protein [Cyanobacteriota bacterium]|nr:ATP-binding protein [Cyanobacteriota bacterium]
MNSSKSLHVKETETNQEGKLLQQFLQLIPDLWYIATKDGYYQQLNGYCWNNLLGWNESDLIAKSILAFVHPEDIEATSKALSELEKNQVVEINIRHHHQDGSYRWIAWRINKSEDELICGIGKEITLDELRNKLKYQSELADDESTYELIDSVSKKVELIKSKLQQTQHKLNSIKSEYKQNSNTTINRKSNSSRIVDFYELEKQIEDTYSYDKLLQSLFITQEENTLEKIIANIPQGILLLDTRYRIVLANQKGRDYLDLLGKIDSSNIITKIGGEAIEELVSSGEEKIIRKFIPHDFPEQIFEVMIQLLIPEPNQNQWLVTIQNISNFVQNDLEVHEALQKEKELNILKSSVVNTVSHEYRTPLTNILLGVQLLKKYHGKLDSKRQMRCFEHIEQSSKHLVQLVDNMLLVSQAESAKLELHRTSLNLVLFTEQLIEDLKLVRGNNYTIKFTSKCTCHEVNLDSNLLLQILNNLLSNAIKYSPDGGEINLDLLCDNNAALFKIKDQGIGIPEQDKQKLFESFQRGSNAGTIRGSGLGLAIVKRCVELHGGEIWFDSIVGSGTTFYVKLPF